MLSFDSGLTNALKNSNTTAFWVLKLYYNDESAFIGVSDRHRQDGSDIYYGLVASWGTYRQSLNFFNFTTSIGNMSVTLINAEKSIQNKRFSDLLTDYNFANRKWELFLNTNETSTLDTAARMIASGVISGEISYDENNMTFTLFDNTSKYHKRVPVTTVDSSTYTNAPKKNIGKPIPMAYGDFHEKSGIGTLPTTQFDRFYNFYKGAFPAIITDEWDVQEEGSEAKVDSQSVHTLDAENVYIYKNGQYPTLTGTVDVTGNPEIEYRGGAASVYIPISTSNLASESGAGSYSVSDEERVGDGSFSAFASWSANSGTTNNSVATMTFALPKINKLGTYSAISALVKWGTNSDFEGDDSETFRYTVGSTHADHDTITDDSETKTAIGSLYSGKTTTWDFEGSLLYTLKGGSANNNHSAQIYESGIVVDFTLEDVQPHQIQELYEGGPIRITLTHDISGPEVVELGYDHNIYSRTATALTPSEIDYIYCSGKGRKYGAWIDTVNSGTRNSQNGGANDPGYAQNDLIENPVYMIEDILRTELSLDASTTGADIDISTFDYVGNTADGFLGDIYEDAVGDVKFAFSQYKFINSKDLVERLGRLCLSYVFIGGDGKFKIKSLRRTDDYSSADQSVNFHDITMDKVGKTSLSAVKNSILIKYSHDYGANQNKSEATATDSTSQGTTVSGYNKTMKLEIDANEILDSTTATKLAEAYLEIMKDRHDTVNFSCVRPKYNHLEIGDIINFSNWPSDLKIYGQTMGGSWDSTTDTFSSVTTTWDNMAAGYFIVADITKTVNGCSIKAIKVS